MRLTPVDIRNHQFGRKWFGGLDSSEVSLFLEEVIKELTLLYGDQQDLENKLKAAETEVERYRRMEGDFAASMSAAQRAAQQELENGRREGQRLITEARAHIQQLNDEQEREMSKKREELAHVITVRERLLRRFESFLENSERFLKQVHDREEEPFFPDDEEGPKRAPKIAETVIPRTFRAQREMKGPRAVARRRG